MPDPKVAIVYGSPSDAEVMGRAKPVLERFGVPYTEAAISAHRAPRVLVRWLADLEAAGLRVVIAGAGLSAALPGVVAAHTVLPVIGVPLKGGALDGLDALLSIAQMPPNVPVATVGLGNATNAAVLAVQILALSDESLAKQLREFKTELEDAARQALPS
jgi:5-(carboxyamino)imidazole ribonucleotide mutase